MLGGAAAAAIADSLALLSRSACRRLATSWLRAAAAPCISARRAAFSAAVSGPRLCAGAAPSPVPDSSKRARASACTRFAATAAALLAVSSALRLAMSSASPEAKVRP